MSALIKNLAMAELPLRLTRSMAVEVHEDKSVQTSTTEPTERGALHNENAAERAHVDGIFSSAKEEAREQAAREGYEQGLIQGQQDALQQHKQKLDALSRLLDSVQTAMGEQIEGLEDVALHIAMTAVMKILGDTLVSPAGIRAVIQQVLRQVRTTEPMAMRLAPQDFYFLLKQKTNAEWVDASWTLPAAVSMHALRRNWGD